jgi:hypothetical protein
MPFRFIILVVVSASLVCCGCRSATLSGKEKLAITDFVQEQTGQHVFSVERRADGDVFVETEVTGRGFDRADFWLLKRGPDGWKLIRRGTMSL